MPRFRRSAPRDKRLSADYELPFQAHATMEPMNCTVILDGDRAEVWAPAQEPGLGSRQVLAG